MTNKSLAKRNGALARQESRKTTPRNADWVLCDISGSMGTVVDSQDYNSRRRIDYLNAALKELGDDVQVIAFSDKIDRERVGEYEIQGSTNICPALRECALFEPTYITIISDGDITDVGGHNEAYGLVTKLAETAVIDTIYIGPDDAIGERFMQEVARIGHGRFRKYEPKALEEKLTKLLPAPEGTVNL